MSRINCHSAFKHYEMFHNMGGDVINIGSNNTTVFKMGAGFGGGSFWSGLGYGLGIGLGSIFGGNMGGFGNFGFGMSPFGMGGFGFGMSPFGLGNIFGGGSNRVDSHSDGKGKVKDDSISNKNIDYAKLNKLFERKNNLLEAKEPKLTDLEKLKNDIDKLAKDLDGNDDGNDNDYIKQLKRGLDDKISELKGKEPATKPAVSEVKGNAEGNKPAAQAPAADNNGKVNAGNDAKNNANGTEPWSNISAWNNDRSLIPRHITLPDGYSKLAPNDTIDSIDKVHDNSGKTKDVKGDTKKSTETYKAQDENTTFPTYLAITTNVNKTYNYKTIGMSNGYPIYGTPKSDKNKNVYVMCKDPDGKVVLLQFEYKSEKTGKTEKMSGYGVKDAQN